MLLIAAFACLLGFHVLPVVNTPPPGAAPERGWMLWVALWENRRGLISVATQEPLWGMGVVATITWLFLATASPFIVPLLLRSSALWGVSSLISGFSFMVGLMILGKEMTSSSSSLTVVPPATISMLLSVLLNFLGLLVLTPSRRDLPGLPG